MSKNHYTTTSALNAALNVAGISESNVKMDSFDSQFSWSHGLHGHE